VTTTAVLRRLATIMLILSIALFAAAAGIVVRDVGFAQRFGVSGQIGPLETFNQLVYAYELPHEIGVSSTVRLLVTVEAPFGDWRIEYVSNGSSLTPFRPALPGAIRITLQNLESRMGEFSTTILARNGIPPHLETSMLNPLLLGSLVTLGSSFMLYSWARRGGREPKGTLL